MIKWQNWTLEAVFARFWRSIPRSDKWNFAWALALGTLTHFYMFVNKLPNGDDLERIYRDFTMTTSGRWFDLAATSLSSWYSAPWPTGIVTLLLLALAVAFLGNVLEIRRPLSGVLMAAAVVTFPVLAAKFSYLFYADLYMMAFFFSVLAVWLTLRWRWGFLLGAVFLGCALGSYQAYISVAMVVCLLVLARVMLKKQGTLPEVLLLAGQMLLMGVLALAFYFGVLNYLLDLWHLTLTDYQGIDQMAQTSGGTWGEIAGQCYQAFAQYFVPGEYFASPLLVQAAYGLLAVLSLLWLARALWKRQIPWFYWLILLLVILALPIAFNAIFIMAPIASLHCLMQPAYLIFWVMPVALLEYAYPPRERVCWSQVLSSWLAALAVAVMAVYFFWVCNACYLHLQLRYEITYATQLRILDDMESVEGYSPYLPVLFVGTFPNDEHAMLPTDTDDLVQGLTGIRGNLVHHDKNYQGFYQYYLGRPLLWPDEEKAETIRQYLRRNPMPQWPLEGSVAIIDDVLVVYINDEFYYYLDKQPKPAPANALWLQAKAAGAN